MLKLEKGIVTIELFFYAEERPVGLPSYDAAAAPAPAPAKGGVMDKVNEFLDRPVMNGV